MAENPIDEFKYPLKEFLDQIDELVRIVKSSEFSEDEIPPMVLDRIVYLEGLGNILSEANETAYQKLGVSNQEIDKAKENIQQEVSDNKRIMSRLENIKKEVQAMQQSFSIAKTIATKQRKNKGKQKVIARQKKFRRMGGDNKGWKSI